MNEELVLIGEKIEINSAGDSVAVPVRRTVFAQKKAVGAAYKLQALAVGLRPKYRFLLADVLEYQGEERAEYRGEPLRVIDNRENEDFTLELTLEGMV